MRVEYAAADGAEHVPAEIEQDDAGRVPDAGDHLLLIEAGLARKIDQLDAVELAVLALLDQRPDRVDHRRVGGLLEHRKQGLGFVHVADLNEFNAAKSQTSASGRAGW